MDTDRKSLAKVEGRKRMELSGLSVAWQGTRTLSDWVAYVEHGPGTQRLVLAERVSERMVKTLVARLQNLPREEVERLALSRPGPGTASPRAGAPVPSHAEPGAEILERLRRLQARLDSLEKDQRELRGELAELRDDQEATTAPPSLLALGWFRALLLLIVMAIVVVVSAPYLIEVFEAASREPWAPARGAVQSEVPLRGAPAPARSP